MRAPIRIFGIGSPFGDDRVGWLVAEALQGLFDPSLVEISSHDRPGAGLVNLMQGAQFVVLVDAVRSGNPVGTLLRLEGDEIHNAISRYTSTHGFGLAEAMALACRLNLAPPSVVLWGIEGLNHGAPEMSDAVREGMARLVASVTHEIHGALASVGHE